MPKPVVIEALPFRSGKRSKGKGGSPFKALLLIFLVLLFGGLAAVGYAIFTFKSVTVETTPPADEVTLTGSLLHFKTGTAWWVQSGTYTVSATKSGYQDQQLEVEINAASPSVIELFLQKKPGILFVRTLPQSAQVSVVDQARAYDTEQGITLESGDYQVNVEAARYFPATTNVTMIGLGKAQEIQLALKPAWAEVQLASTPTASVSIDSTTASNTTPCTIELLEGRHSLELHAEGFETFHTQVVSVAGQPMDLGTIQLELAHGRVRVTSSPAGAQITIDGQFAGQTPLVVETKPNREHAVTIFKPGYASQTKSVIVSPGKEVSLDFALKPQEGEIRFTINPPDAELIVDGTSFGKVPPSISLVAIAHRIEIVHPDFKPLKKTIKPRPNFPQEIKADLIPKHVVVIPSGNQEQAPATSEGYVFKFIKPGPYQMGSSRREQGRRSNETLRNIELQRPFFMGVHEISNKDFRAFRPEHNSGNIQTVSLNRDEQPVVNVTWEDAVRYCNWLSEKDKLTPAYREVAGKMMAKIEPANGYRLPTEAEWEYCSRYTAPGNLLKYPWGDGFPPTVKAGNYGDQSATDFVDNPLPGYADGYPGPAPVGSFSANQHGLFDMNGNVSEWCHDVYQIYPYSPTKAYIDPLGPEEEGDLWVIRGASYKSTTITTLRYCYRNYAKEKKSDVGFRICRYVE